ncbi:MAG: NADPH-dependent F420 reductase [Chloroflexota bacterium]|nr:NADPH-dependent F420 reductase [Chloroflexota bacterium]
MPDTIAIIGGTGPEGRGLASRFALAGHRVVIGSRDATRGASVAAEVAATLAGRDGAGPVEGASNADAATAGEIAVVTVPFEGHRATLEALVGELAGKIVVDAVVPVRFERGPRPVEVAEGSATEQAAAVLPDSRVVGAFHNLAAESLLDLDAPVLADVLVTGSDAAAKQAVSALAEQIDGVRAVDAGPLRYSRFVEGLTVLLIGVNMRHRARTHVRIEGLPV